MKTRNGNHVCVIGCGEVTQHRIAPALRQLAANGMIESIAFADIREGCPLGVIGHDCDEQYIQVSPTEGLPPWVLHHWRDCPIELAIIACPTPSHRLYIEQLETSADRIACEKPLSLSVDDAQILCSYGRPLFCVDHYLWKSEMLRALQDVRDGVLDLSDLDHIEFDLMECVGTQGRAIENAVFDLVWHGLGCALALLTSARIESRFIIKTSRVGTYHSKDYENAPSAFTAARVEGVLELDGGRTIDIIACVGKGLARKCKQIKLGFRSGCDSHIVALEEPDPAAAHMRLLRNLLRRQFPDFLSSRANIGIVKACRRACDIAIDLGFYPFGTMAPFLNKSEACVAPEIYY